MKKIFLLLLSGLLVAACFRHAGEEGEEPSPEPAPASSYLSFTLVSAQPVGTKAPYTEGDGEYEDGTPEENNVSRVRFFFFDKDGKAADVRKSASTENGYSWIDWYPSEADNKGNPDHNKTVEKILTATLGLSFTDENKPASVMAIINPTDGVLGLGNASLAALQGVVSDFETGLQNNNFVMSNSVYVADEGKEGAKAVYATELKDEDFCTTPEAAVAAPVSIYVERVLARVDFTVNMTNEFVGDNIYELTDPDEHDYAVDGRSKKIYVKLLGWNTTTTANVSRLVKEVYPNWTSQGLFGPGSILRWNTTDYSRSFWALNPDPENSKFAYQIGNFGSVDGYFDVEDDYPANGNGIPETGKWSTVYLQENASAYAAKNAELTGPADASKVIIAAQLMEKEGEEYKPLSLAMWEYKHYTLESLKTVFANRLDLYYEDENATAGYTKIKPEDIDFKTWEQLKGGDVSSDAKTDDAEYYVYPVLSEIGKEKQWNKGGVPGAKLDLKQAQDRMREMLNRAMVWNSGLTYYFFDIRHLGEEGSVAETGIVRNHLYATTVKSIKGLGTPVYDPGQTIHPQVPEYDESFISAAVEILSWRVVSSSYEIEWK